MKRLDSRWRFGAAVVGRLLPHGPAIRMVDGIADFDADALRIETYLHIGSSHPVFASHFGEGLQMWPGVYTLEGMAQTVIVAVGLRDLVRIAADRGHPERLVTDALRSIDDRAAMRPSATTQALSQLEAMVDGATARIGVLATAQTRWERPVVPGCRLDYEATLTHANGGTYRADVQARVDGVRVATATLTTVDAPPA